MTTTAIRRNFCIGLAPFLVIALCLPVADGGEVRFQKLNATTLSIYHESDSVSPIGQVEFGLLDAGAGHFLAPSSDDLPGHVTVVDTPGLTSSATVKVFYDGVESLPSQTYFRESLEFTFPGVPGATFMSYVFGVDLVDIRYVFDLGPYGLHEFHLYGETEPAQTDIFFAIPTVYSPGPPGAAEFYVAPTVRRKFTGALDSSLPLFHLSLTGELAVPEPSGCATILPGLIGGVSFRFRRQLPFRIITAAGTPD